MAGTYQPTSRNRTLSGATRPRSQERGEWERLELTAAYARPGQLRRTASHSYPRSRSRAGSGSRSRTQYSAREYQQLLKENGNDGRSRLRFHPIAQILVSFALINVGLIGLIIVLQIKGLPIPQPFASLPLFGFGILVGIPILCVLIIVLQHRHLFYFETEQRNSLRPGTGTEDEGEEDSDFELEEEDEASSAAFYATAPLVGTSQRRGFMPPPPPPPPSTSVSASGAAIGGTGSNAALSASPSLQEFEAEAHRRLAGRPRQHYAVTYRGDNSESRPFEVLQNPAHYQAQTQPGERDRLDRQIARAVAARPEALTPDGSRASASRLQDQGYSQRLDHSQGPNVDLPKEF